MDQVSPSQSLFQVYYLSAVEVDRRCGIGVLPWIIEELKLKLETAQDMRLIWITLGMLLILSGLLIYNFEYRLFCKICNSFFSLIRACLFNWYSLFACSYMTYITHVLLASLHEGRACLSLLIDYV